jgi:hypothetical protein
LRNNKNIHQCLGLESLSWLHFGSRKRGVTPNHARRQRITAVRLLKGLYGRNPVPGIILGDEVGMGKTYEIFGVIAALFRHNPEARVVVFAHSKSMAETWLARWTKFSEENVDHDCRPLMAKGEILWSHEYIGNQGLFFGSYETFKRASTIHQRAMLEWILKGSGWHERTRKDIRWKLFGRRRNGGQLEDHFPHSPNQQARHSILKLLLEDPIPIYRILHELRRMVLHCYRTKRKIDLLVVDEAHKVTDGQREVFFTEVLNGRAEKVLYVTATPFALDLDELLDIIEDMFECVGADTSPVNLLRSSLDQFRNVVETRGHFSQSDKAKLQNELGAYLVRSCWPSELQPGKGPRRLPKQLTATTTFNEEMTLASLALETAFLRIQSQNARTHRASHRETLCSSYAAIRESIQKKEAKFTLDNYFRALGNLIPTNHESPKFETAAAFLQATARRKQKVVVFCKRLATVRRLRQEIHRNLKLERDRAGKMWKSALSKLSRRKASSETKELTRMAIYLTGQPVCPASSSMQRRLMRDAGNVEPDDLNCAQLIRKTWGPHRRIDWVAELSGETHEDGGRGRSPEAVRFAFNLPGPPYILICTNIAREGIDLHHWCRRVMHYDLEWNPASMEQQVGRVDRLNSYSARTQKPIEVIFVYQPKTYEARIVHVVQKRCEMLRVLLGAGQWLAEVPEEQGNLSDLEKYRLDFHP